MAVTSTCSNHYKWSLAKKMIDLSTDSIKVLLMRSGFVFNKDTHGTLKNIRTNTGAIGLVWAVADKSVSRTTGSFITDGFVVGNSCKSDDTLNVGPKIIATVTALKITFVETVAASSATKTLSSDDELATLGGYTQNTKTTGTITLVEDNAFDYLKATFPTVKWTAVGGSIGPTPGAILYDDTSTDDTIIGYLNFGGEQTTVSGTTLHIGDGFFKIA